MATRRRLPVSGYTAWTYAKQGYDTKGPDGRHDPEKLETIRRAKAAVERERQRRVASIAEWRQWLSVALFRSMISRPVPLTTIDQVCSDADEWHFSVVWQWFRAKGRSPYSLFFTAAHLCHFELANFEPDPVRVTDVKADTTPRQLALPFTEVGSLSRDGGCHSRRRL
jgi:hypothetical protein